MACSRVALFAALRRQHLDLAPSFVESASAISACSGTSAEQHAARHDPRRNRAMNEPSTSSALRAMPARGNRRGRPSSGRRGRRRPDAGLPALLRDGEDVRPPRCRAGPRLMRLDMRQCRKALVPVLGGADEFQLLAASSIIASLSCTVSCSCREGRFRDSGPGSTRSGVSGQRHATPGSCGHRAPAPQQRPADSGVTAPPDEPDSASAAAAFYNPAEA